MATKTRRPVTTEAVLTTRPAGAMFSDAEVRALRQVAARELAVSDVPDPQAGEVQVMLNVRLSPRMRAAVQARAKSLGTDMSAVMRGLLLTWLTGDSK